MRLNASWIDVTNASDETDIAVASTNTAYSKAFKLPTAGDNFSIAIKATSDGTVSLLVQLEQSWINLTEIGGEGIANVKYVIPENASNIFTDLDDADWHIIAHSPVASPYARFKLTGQGSNDATTEVEIKVLFNELI